MKKRFFAWALAICMILMMIPVVANADETAPALLLYRAAQDQNGNWAVESTGYRGIGGSGNEVYFAIQAGDHFLTSSDQVTADNEYAVVTVADVFGTISGTNVQLFKAKFDATVSEMTVTTISYTWDGTTYTGDLLSNPVAGGGTVITPQQLTGWFTSSACSSETQLPNWKYYYSGDTVELYYATSRELVIQNFERKEGESYYNGELGLQVEYIENAPNCVKVTISGLSSAPDSVSLLFGHTDASGSPQVDLTLEREVSGVAWITEWESVLRYDLSLLPGHTATGTFYQYDNFGSARLDNITSVSSGNTDILTVASAEETGNFTLTAVAVGTTQVTVTYGNGESAYFSVTVPNVPTPAQGQDQCVFYTMTVNDKEYVVGFGIDMNTDAPYFPGGYVNVGVTTDRSENTTYTLFRNEPLTIAAFTASEDKTHYEVISENEVSIVVKKAWMEWIEGDVDTFSFSTDSWTYTKDSFDSGKPTFDLYFRAGRPGVALVKAEIDITVNGTTTATTVAMRVASYAVYPVSIYRPDNDTTKDLNAFLETFAQERQKNVTYTVYLGDTTYEGTIEIPAALAEMNNEGSNSMFIVKGTEKQGGVTRIQGGIDLNGTYVHLHDLHFSAGSENTSAVYGGTVTNMHNCSFTGYPVAVDATAGMITLTSGNVFVHNDVAARVDVRQLSGGNKAPWQYNTFIGNGTAVQILSLNGWISPYYFRICDNNFINNSVDFDVQCEGKVFYYRNYFGTYKTGITHPEPGRGHGRDNLHLMTILEARTVTRLNGILVSRPASVSKGENTEVVVNPRWKYPVMNWWKGSVSIEEVLFGVTSNAAMTLDDEPDYENILIADWDSATELPFTEVGELQMNGEAFAGTGEKKIDVVSDQGTLYTWTFGSKSESEQEGE